MNGNRGSRYVRVATWVSLAALSLLLPGFALVCNLSTGAVTAAGRLIRASYGTVGNHPLIEDRFLFGALIAVAVLALLWFGAGIMDAAMRLCDLLLAALLGSGILTGLMVMGIAEVVGPITSYSLATFTEPAQNWKALPGLPEAAVAIEDAGPYRLNVRTVSGKVYGCQPYKQPPTPWVETPQPFGGNGSERRVPIGSTTGLPSTPVSTVGIQFNPCAECGEQVDYVVLADGSVWWSARQFSNPLFGMVGLLLVVPRLFAALLALCIPAFLGAAVVWLGRAAQK